MGSAQARERLLEQVYHELKVIAGAQLRHERSDHTLGATALVNESYLRLIRSLGGDAANMGDGTGLGDDAGADLVTGIGDGAGDGAGDGFLFSHRHAFYKAAATAMQRILIDHARSKATLKRSVPIGARKISLDVLEASTLSDPQDLLSLDAALSRLDGEDGRAGQVVRLRFFAGRTIEEIAQMLGVSSRTVKRDWEFARARLQQLIEEQDGNEDGSC